MVQAVARQTTNIVQEKYKNTNFCPKVWTERGLKKLGQIIRISRENQRLSLDEMADIVLRRTGRSISKKTLGNIENGVGEPKYNTLAIIAAVKIVVDGQGKYLSIEDFMDIASEVEFFHTSTQTKSMSLEKMIRKAMADNKISQEAVEASLIQQVLNNIGNIDLEKFRDILTGSTQQISIEELRLIVNAVDPEQEVFSWWDWERQATTENPAHHWQGQQNNHIS